MAGSFMQGVIVGAGLHKKPRGSAGTGSGLYTSVRDSWDYPMKMGVAVGQALAAEGLRFPDDVGEASGGSPEEDDTAPDVVYRLNDFKVTAGADVLAPGFSLPQLVVKRAATYSNVCEGLIEAAIDGDVLVRAGQRFELYFSTANASGLLRGMGTNGAVVVYDTSDSFLPAGRTAARINPDSDGRWYGALGIMQSGGLTVANKAATLKGIPLRDILSLKMRWTLASGAASSAGITMGMDDFYLKLWNSSIDSGS